MKLALLILAASFCFGPVRRTRSNSDFSRPLRSSLRPILRLRRFLRLPLHILGRIRATALQWLDMIHDVAGAGAASLARRRTRMLAFEFGSGFATPGDSAVGVASAARAAGGAT